VSRDALTMTLAAGPAGRSFPGYRIDQDLEKLCKGLAQSQDEIDKIRSALGYPSIYWSPRIYSCLYLYRFLP
jgi:hypothetical protein